MKQLPWCGHLPQILLDCSNLDRDLYLTVGFGTQYAEVKNTICYRSALSPFAFKLFYAQNY